MKTFLAAALAALPLAALPSDPAPAKGTDKTQKMEVPAELDNTGAAPAKPKAAEAKPDAPKADPAKPPAKPAPAKADAKTAAKDGKPAPKTDEKPCEPVKPCSIE